uniref:Uncharacterized protein n=1 Tax=Hucho hucho TaxID=62062 RepID=A0A4W5RAP9_9TELE
MCFYLIVKQSLQRAPLPGRLTRPYRINMDLYLRGALAVLYVTLTCNGFIIDSRFPVIKDGKTMGSFFGFSVALHKQTKGSNKYLLLAGAPKEKALALWNVNETGAIYSCPVTTELNDCARMDLVSSSKYWHFVTVTVTTVSSPYERVYRLNG